MNASDTPTAPPNDGNSTNNPCNRARPSGMFASTSTFVVSLSRSLYRGRTLLIVSTSVNAHSGMSSSPDSFSMSKPDFTCPMIHMTPMNATDSMTAAIALRVNTATTVDTAYTTANVNVSAGITRRNDGFQMPERIAITSHTAPMVNDDTRNMNVSPPMYLYTSSWTRPIGLEMS